MLDSLHKEDKKKKIKEGERITEVEYVIIIIYEKKGDLVLDKSGRKKR